MNSPVKPKKADKENDYTRISPVKGSKKFTLFKINVEPMYQQLPKKDKESVVLQGLIPMDVNTSFDEEVPEEG